MLQLHVPAHQGYVETLSTKRTWLGLGKRSCSCLKDPLKIRFRQLKWSESWPWRSHKVISPSCHKIQHGASSGRTRQQHEVFKWCSATQHSPLLQINGKWLLLVEHRQRGEHGLSLSWQETKQDTAWIMAVSPQCLTLHGWPTATSFRLFVETAALITWSLYLAHQSFHFLCSCTPFFMVYFKPLGDIFK